MMTNKQSATDFGVNLLSVIATKDAVKTIELVRQYKENMRDVFVGAEYVVWISEPTNLTQVQKSLSDNLDIPQRAMAIKRILMSRPQRASLLIQAMEIAIKRVHLL